MSLIIRAAARTLPASIRDRYREQWLADARDATEAGLRPASIAVAALAFAVTFDRPFPARRVPTAEQRARRSRLAVGLGLSAALLSLSTYPGVSFSGLTGNDVWDFTNFFVGMLLLAYALLAPITALVLVRGARARVAVVLFAVASVSPIARGIIDSGYTTMNIYLSFGALALLGAVLLVIIGCALLWKPSAMRIVRAPVIGAIAVWLLTGIGLVYGNSVAWSEEVPLAVVAANPALWAEWQVMRAEHETIVAATLIGWAIAGAVVGVIVFLIGRRMSERGAIALGLAAVAISLLGATGVFGLLELGIADSVLPVLLDPMRQVAQVLLTAVILVAVGGVRYLPRVRGVIPGASST